MLNMKVGFDFVNSEYHNLIFIMEMNRKQSNCDEKLDVNYCIIEYPEMVLIPLGLLLYIMT